MYRSYSSCFQPAEETRILVGNEQYVLVLYDLTYQNVTNIPETFVALSGLIFMVRVWYIHHSNFHTSSMLCYSEYTLRTNDRIINPISVMNMIISGQFSQICLNLWPLNLNSVSFHSTFHLTSLLAGVFPDFVNWGPHNGYELIVELCSWHPIVAKWLFCR